MTRLYEAVSAGRKHQGIEHWLPFFHDRLETLVDYLPGRDDHALDDQVTPARLSRWDTIVDQYEARKHALNQKTRGDTVYKPVPPDLLYLDDSRLDPRHQGPPDRCSLPRCRRRLDRG